MATLPTPDGLWPALRRGGAGSLAVVGLAKNTGKTVALNHLLVQAAAEGLAVGLSSIGRDGEALDAVFSIPKPPVQVAAGTLVATARDTLSRARVRTRLLGGTGIASPMGEIVLVRTLDAGTMEVAGASRGADQQRVVTALRACGAALVLLDGALGRSQHASPAIAESVLLATGAALGGGMADVLRKTRERLALLEIPAVDEALRARCAPLFAGQGVALWTRDGHCRLQAEIPTLNAAEALLRHAGSAPVATVACTGAVGRGLWRALLALAERSPGLQVVVADGTRLFVDAADLDALQRRGGALVAWRAIRVAGITLNPFSPLGGHFEPGAFLAAARAALPGRPLADVWQEQGLTFDPEQPDGQLAA